MFLNFSNGKYFEMKKKQFYHLWFALKLLFFLLIKCCIRMDIQSPTFGFVAHVTHRNHVSDTCDCTWLFDASIAFDYLGFYSYTVFVYGFWNSISNKSKEVAPFLNHLCVCLHLGTYFCVIESTVRTKKKRFHLKN